MRKFLNLFPLILSLIIMQSNLFAQSQVYKIIDKIVIGGELKWDYLSVDTSTHRLFVSHSSEVDVINLDNDSLVGRITGLNGVHGIAFAAEYGKGFITNGKGNTITMFDLKTLSKINEIPSTGNDPDGIVYDLFTHRIFTSNGHGSNMTAINAETGSVVGTVTLDGAPESCVSDYAGRMFVNLEEENAIDVFDPTSLKVIAKWPIAPCGTPTGIAMDRSNHRLFVGGRNKIAVILDSDSGKVIANFPIGSGVDACAFDPMARLAFFSNGDGTSAEIEENSSFDFALVGNISTLPRAKTMALDETTHRLYTSTMIETANGEKTFGVLILDRK